MEDTIKSQVLAALSAIGLSPEVVSAAFVVDGGKLSPFDLGNGKTGPGLDDLPSVQKAAVEEALKTLEQTLASGGTGPFVVNTDTYDDTDEPAIEDDFYDDDYSDGYDDDYDDYSDDDDSSLPEATDDLNPESDICKNCPDYTECWGSTQESKPEESKPEEGGAIVDVVVEKEPVFAAFADLIADCAALADVTYVTFKSRKERADRIENLFNMFQRFDPEF